jgi:hypothetical protein
MGDPAVRARRLRALRGIPALAVTDDATRLAGELVRRGALPEKATVDAFHIGVAAAHQIKYSLTWNCKYLANATMRGTIEKSAALRGFDVANYLHARGTANRESTVKRRDLIIDQLHRVREDIGRAHDFDVDRIATTIRKHEDESAQPVVRESPKRSTRRQKAS